MIAHIVDTMTPDAMDGVWLLVGLSAVAFVAWLGAQNHLVKHGRVRFDRFRLQGARLEGARRALAALVVVSLVLVPGSAGGQDRPIPIGLPDLISDPPYIWFDKTLELADGSVAMVVSFDGFLRNNGVGVLELFGNPQIDGDMKQRWWDGDQWVVEEAARVLYETSDDHNHFHLMAAAEYELWNEARTEKVGDSSKVGFCLVDSLQRTPLYEEYYSIDQYDYCQVENPGATELRMGITPGWADLYDANTTLQWVDVSRTQPGRYWVGAIIDPEDQIVESNEENNGLVFSENKFAVTGYRARPLPRQQAGSPIRLLADAVGEVGDVVWQVVQAPSHGRLNVDSGVDFFDPDITYWPTGDFAGVDSFTVTARDLSSAFPLRPAPVTIEVDASDWTAQAIPEQVLDRVVFDPVALDPVEFFEWSATEIDVGALVADDDLVDPIWTASGLAGGLRIDPDTGVIAGVATLSPPGTATVRAETDAGVSVYELSWTVARPDEQNRGLDSLNDFSTEFGLALSHRVGARVDKGEYSATGLPDGITISPNVPLLAGTPQQIGTFEIEVITSIDDETVDRTSFNWTVRPAAVPQFAL